MFRIIFLTLILSLSISLFADNTVNTAQELGNLVMKKTITNSVDENDQNDYFSFTLNKTTKVKILLDQMKSDANLGLYGGPDKRLLATSLNTGSKNDSITKKLGKGTYYVRVFFYVNPNDHSSGTTYRLTIQNMVPIRIQ